MRRLLGAILLIASMSCGGDSGSSPSPTTSGQQVRLAFRMVKDEWYDCAIAVSGTNHNKTISISVNGDPVGSLTCGSAVPGGLVKNERFEMIVTPGSYNYRATGENYKYEPLVWSGTALANYPNGTTISLVCN